MELDSAVFVTAKNDEEAISEVTSVTAVADGSDDND